jgi:hypothetical protein
MSELLQFMYQGEVNVKQAELQAFMSIAESLQIKGLATSSGSNNSSSSNAMKGSDPMNSSYSQFHSNNGGAGVQRNHNQHQFNSGGNHAENHRQTTSTPLSTTSSIEGNHHATTMKGAKLLLICEKILLKKSSTFFSSGKMVDNTSNSVQQTASSTTSSSYSQKRTIDQISEQQQQRQMKMKRQTHDISDSDMNDSIDNMTSDDIFLPASMQPHVTINESPRFDASSVKRESGDGTRPQSPNSVYRNSYRECTCACDLLLQCNAMPFFLSSHQTIRTSCRPLPFPTFLNSPTATCQSSTTAI